MKSQPYSLIAPYLLPCIITLVMTVIMLIGSGADTWLKYDRIGIQQGEIWRLLTAHFTHLNTAHAIMNLLGFWLYWLFFGKQFRPYIHLSILLLSTLPISLGLFWFNPELRWYVGFSGVLHALFIGACILEIPSRRLDSLILLILMCAKLLWEFFMGPLPGSEETVGGRVVVDAHLYGAISGLLIAMVLMIWNRPNVAKQSIP